jgi:hypothetical protein
MKRGLAVWGRGWLREPGTQLSGVGERRPAQADERRQSFLRIMAPQGKQRRFAEMPAVFVFGESTESFLDSRGRVLPRRVTAVNRFLARRREARVATMPELGVLGRGVEATIALLWDWPCSWHGVASGSIGHNPFIALLAVGCDMRPVIATAAALSLASCGENRIGPAGAQVKTDRTARQSSTSTPRGQCVVRAWSWGPSPSLDSPERGAYYTRRGVRASSLDEARDSCSHAVFTDLTTQYCAANPNFPVTWEVVYEATGTCASSGCEVHNCPATSAACVVRTPNLPSPDLSAPWYGPGYEKVGVIASSLDEARAKCGDAFPRIRCPADRDVVWEVILANGSHACASSGCPHHCPPLPTP